MTNVLKSASKIVFLILTVTACAGFFLGKLESQDFMVLAVSAFTFYFSFKGNDKEIYAGK
jgi:asparagine N-glycosylation enzyme membrane subunit Stt3